MILRNYRQHYRIENLRKIIEKLSLSKKVHLSPTPTHATDLTVVEQDTSTSGGWMQELIAISKIVFYVFFHAFASFVEAFQLQGSKVSGRSVTFMHHLFFISSFNIGSKTEIGFAEKYHSICKR